jgi:hypothetical protein
MSEALYRRLINTAAKPFGQIVSDNRQTTDRPATIYSITSVDDASLAVAPRSSTGKQTFEVCQAVGGVKAKLRFQGNEPIIK